MSKLNLIIKREFIAKVRNKSFIVMTFLSPLILVGMGALVFFLMKKNDEKVKAEEKKVSKGVENIDKRNYDYSPKEDNINNVNAQEMMNGVYYEIKEGKIVGMLDDVAYQSNTQEFWNSCVKICDKSDYRMFGSFFDGKGQPSQVSAVSHGSSTARFNNINVINTGRSI